MSGQLVIAELEAFRAVLAKATMSDTDAIKLWSRSTITNALHRVGPTDAMKRAAEQAWTDADAFADRLSEAVTANDMDAERDRALRSIDALITVVRAARGARHSVDDAQ